LDRFQNENFGQKYFGKTIKKIDAFLPTNEVCFFAVKKDRMEYDLNLWDLTSEKLLSLCFESSTVQSDLQTYKYGGRVLVADYNIVILILSFVRKYWKFNAARKTNSKEIEVR